MILFFLMVSASGTDGEQLKQRVDLAGDPANTQSYVKPLPTSARRVKTLLDSSSDDEDESSQPPVSTSLQNVAKNTSSGDPSATKRVKTLLDSSSDDEDEVTLPQPQLLASTAVESQSRQPAPPDVIANLVAVEIQRKVVEDDAERQRKEAEETERQRKEAEETERQRKEAEETERKQREEANRVEKERQRKEMEESLAAHRQLELDFLAQVKGFKLTVSSKDKDTSIPHDANRVVNVDAMFEKAWALKGDGLEEYIQAMIDMFKRNLGKRSSDHKGVGLIIHSDAKQLFKLKEEFVNLDVNIGSRFESTLRTNGKEKEDELRYLIKLLTFEAHKEWLQAKGFLTAPVSAVSDTAAAAGGAQSPTHSSPITLPLVSGTTQVGSTVVAPSAADIPDANQPVVTVPPSSPPHKTPGNSPKEDDSTITRRDISSAAAASSDHSFLDAQGRLSEETLLSTLKADNGKLASTKDSCPTQMTKLEGSLKSIFVLSGITSGQFDVDFGKVKEALRAFYDSKKSGTLGNFLRGVVGTDASTLEGKLNEAVKSLLDLLPSDKVVRKGAAVPAQMVSAKEPHRDDADDDEEGMGGAQGTMYHDDSHYVDPSASAMAAAREQTPQATGRTVSVATSGASPQVVVGSELTLLPADVLNATFTAVQTSFTVVASKDFKAALEGVKTVVRDLEKKNKACRATMREREINNAILEGKVDKAVEDILNPKTGALEAARLASVNWTTADDESNALTLGALLDQKLIDLKTAFGILIAALNEEIAFFQKQSLRDSSQPRSVSGDDVSKVIEESSAADQNTIPSTTRRALSVSSQHSQEDSTDDESSSRHSDGFAATERVLNPILAAYQELDSISKNEKTEKLILDQHFIDMHKIIDDLKLTDESARRIAKVTLDEIKVARAAWNSVLGKAKKRDSKKTLDEKLDVLKNQLGELSKGIVAEAQPAAAGGVASPKGKSPAQVPPTA